MRKWDLKWWVVLSLVALAMEFKTAMAEGLGVTCWARPVSLHRAHGHNVCFKVPETQYPGINALGARPATVKKCQDANALDPGCGQGVCCYPQCEKVTTCLGLTPNFKRKATE